MRIAVIGAQGQLGHDVMRCLGQDALPIGREMLDITDDAAVQSVLGSCQSDAVINLAAYNLVDKAEEQTNQAFAVNAEGPRSIARYCRRADIPLLHVSTDHVFGLDAERRTPYLESDVPGPVNAYGLSKLAGEYFVRAECPPAIIVRTCGLYGKSATKSKGNFVEKMQKLAESRDEIRVVADQICTPTNTAHLAPLLGQLLHNSARGIFHVTNRGETTWADFAREIFQLAHLNTRVVSISTSDFGAVARRPAYSVLNTGRVRNLLGLELPTWRDALQEYLREKSS